MKRSIIAVIILPAVLTLAHAAALDDARTHIARGDYARAASALNRHLATHPGDESARFLLARTLAWDGRPEEALEHYARLLDAEPDNVDYLLAQGQALLWAGQPRAALSPLKRAARLAPDYTEVQDVISQARAAQHTPHALVLPFPDDAPHAQERRRTEAGLTLRHEWLDSGYDNWQAGRINVVSSRADAPTWYGSLVQERRFGSTEQGFEAGIVVPLDDNWSIQPEIGINPGADFLPRWYADLRLQRTLARGWIGASSLRRTHYADGRVDRLALTAEHYRGAWRTAWTVNVSAVSGAGTQVGHDVSLDHYYSGLSFIGLRAGFGREEAVIGRDVLTSDVRSIALRGRHWIDERWAVGWDVGTLRQGDLYRRHWLQLGLHHAF